MYVVASEKGVLNWWLIKISFPLLSKVFPFKDPSYGVLSVIGSESNTLTNGDTSLKKLDVINEWFVCCVVTCL